MRRKALVAVGALCLVVVSLSSCGTSGTPSGSAPGHGTALVSDPAGPGRSHRRHGNRAGQPGLGR